MTDINALLIRLHDCVAKAQPELLPQVEKLWDILRRQTLRVAVVGGFSRGKSHFINQLLGQKLLPEYAVPTTGCLTEIGWAEKPSLCILSRTGEECCELTEANVSKYGCIPDAGPGLKHILRINLPLPLLRDGMEILDTPGVEDTNTDVADITYTALENADAAIVMVSAVMPLSLSEREFINVYLKDRAIPLLAAGISFLDQVPADRLAQQMDFLCRKIHDLYPQMAILEMGNCGIGQEKDVVCGVERVRQFLNDWQRLPRLGQIRQNMVLRRATQLLQGVIAELEGQVEMLQGDVEERQKQLTEAIGRLDDHSDFCDSLKSSFLEQKEALQDRIRKQIRSMGSLLGEEIKGNPDPEGVIAARFNELNHELWDYVCDKVTTDVARLSEQFRQLYGAPLQLNFGNNVPETIVVTKWQADGDDMPPMVEMLLARGLKLVDFYAPRVPLGVMLWPILRPHVAKFAQMARDWLRDGFGKREDFEHQISVLCSRLNISLKEKVDALYGDIFAGVRDLRLQWLASRRDFLMANSGVDERRQKSENCQQLLASARTLLQDMRRGMEK